MYSGARVKLLSFYRLEIERSAEPCTKEGLINGKLTTVISRWTAALLSVESRIVWRISCNPTSEGAQEAMAVWKERRGTEEKRYAFELTTRFSIHCTQTTVWPCLRSGTVAQATEKTRQKSKEIGERSFII